VSLLDPAHILEAAAHLLEIFTNRLSVWWTRTGELQHWVFDGILVSCLDTKKLTVRGVGLMGKFFT
jgi:hypothetical protein